MRKTKCDGLNEECKETVMNTGNKIGDKGAAKIGESLTKNTTLTAVSLGCDVEQKDEGKQPV